MIHDASSGKTLTSTQHRNSAGKLGPVTTFVGRHPSRKTPSDRTFRTWQGAWTVKKSTWKSYAISSSNEQLQNTYKSPTASTINGYPKWGKLKRKGKISLTAMMRWRSIRRDFLTFLRRLLTRGKRLSSRSEMQGCRNWKSRWRILWLKRKHKCSTWWKTMNLRRHLNCHSRLWVMRWRLRRFIRGFWSKYRRICCSCRR